MSASSGQKLEDGKVGKVHERSMDSSSVVDYWWYSRAVALGHDFCRLMISVLVSCADDPARGVQGVRAIDSLKEQHYGCSPGSGRLPDRRRSDPRKALSYPARSRGVHRGADSCVLLKWCGSRE